MKLDDTSRFERHLAMMPQERRLSTRKPLEHLAYLSLPPNNGGIVVDVSEGGLGFHAIAPVEPNGPIQFRFAIDSAERVSAVGELAWKDETGKTGGLRFTQLPDELREQIRVWASQSKVSVKASFLDIPHVEPAIKAEVAPSSNPDLAPYVDIPLAEPAIEAEVALSSQPDLEPYVDIPPAEPAMEAEVALRSNSDLESAEDIPGAESAIENEFAPIRKSEIRPVVAAREALLYNLSPPIYSAPFNKLSMFPADVNSESEASVVTELQSFVKKHPIAAVGLTIALAFLVAIGISTYVFTTRAGELLYDWGEKMWGGSYSQPIQQGSPPSASSAPDSSKLPRR